MNKKGMHTHFLKHYHLFHLIRHYRRNQLFFEVLSENRNSRNSLNFRSLLCFFARFCDPPGIRTQDPNIKSVVLYLLS